MRAVVGAVLVVGLWFLGGCDWFPSASPPSAPTGFTASWDLYEDRVVLSWDEVTRADDYEVWRSLSEAGDYQRLARVTATSFEDRDVVAGMTYWYKVRACNGAGCGDFTAPASGRAKVQDPGPSTPPPVPSGLTASQGTLAGRVRLTWQAAPGATGYVVLRSTSPSGGYGELAAVTTTSYDDTTVVPGKHYWYEVEACNAAGCSGPSQAVMGYAPEEEMPPPPPPHP